MGCGKSILGKALASQVNISFLDLDKKIEEYEKKPVHEIFELKGELYFRQIERKILLELIGFFDSQNCFIRRRCTLLFYKYDRYSKFYSSVYLF